MRRSSHRKPTFRPCLEALESRWCPSLSANEFQVNTTIAHDQLGSANASTADGRHVVVWTDYSSGNGNIKARRYDAAGQPVGGEIMVANTARNEHLPDVGMDANGNFVVVWTADGGGASQDVLGA